MSQSQGNKPTVGALARHRAFVCNGGIVGLNLNELRVMQVYMMAQDNDTGEAYPSNEHIAVLAFGSEGFSRAVTTARNGLVKKGRLELVRASSGRPGDCPVYRVAVPISCEYRKAKLWQKQPERVPATGTPIVGERVPSVDETGASGCGDGCHPLTGRVPAAGTLTPYVTPNRTPSQTHSVCESTKVQKQGTEDLLSVKAVTQHYRDRWASRHKGPCPWTGRHDKIISELVKVTGERARDVIDAFFATNDKLVIEEAHKLELLLGPKLAKYTAQAHTRRPVKPTQPLPAPAQEPVVADKPPSVSAEPIKPATPPELPPIITPDPPGFVLYWNKWPNGTGKQRADRQACRRAWDDTNAELRTPAVLAKLKQLIDDMGLELVAWSSPLSLLDSLNDTTETEAA